MKKWTLTSQHWQYHATVFCESGKNNWLNVAGNDLDERYANPVSVASSLRILMMDMLALGVR